MGEEPKPKRPRGITILAILFIIGGGYGLYSFLGFGIEPSPFEGLPEMSLEEQGWFVYSISSAILAIAVGGAMFSGKSWAWPVIIILVIIDLALAVLSQIFSLGITPILIVIDAIVLWYLRKPHVKEYFGRNK